MKKASNIPPIKQLPIRTHWDYAPGSLTEKKKICNRFGCGRQLSLRESLAGVTCVEHSLPGATVKSIRLTK